MWFPNIFVRFSLDFLRLSHDCPSAGAFGLYDTTVTSKAKAQEAKQGVDKYSKSLDTCVGRDVNLNDSSDTILASKYTSSLFLMSQVFLNLFVYASLAENWCSDWELRFQLHVGSWLRIFCLHLIFLQGWYDAILFWMIFLVASHGWCPCVTRRLGH